MINIDMTGKITLVTGAGGGIGGGVAEVFARAGSKVYVADLYLENAQKKVDEIRKEGFLAEAVKMDVTNKEEIYAVIDKIVADNGKIDNVITSAGAIYNKPYMTTTDEELRFLLEINLVGVNNTCQAALKHMIQRKEGKIVNVQSASSRQGSGIWSHYSASKFGVMGLTQSIALAVAKDNINVNGICPGLVVTDLGEQQNSSIISLLMKTKNQTREEVLEGMRVGIPMQRFQSAEDMGNACLFLCSDLAKNITGQSLNVDGAMRLN